jgi:D-alanine-D-alanine ligase
MRTRIGVMFGGRSSEHEVSVRSAASVLGHLDRSKYQPFAIYIDPQGRWILPSRWPEAATDAEARSYVHGQASSSRGHEVVMPARPSGHGTLLVCPDSGGATAGRAEAGAAAAAAAESLDLDLAFPVLHGPYGEDGTIQGLFELANLPYVGAGVMASAVGMDKAVMKTLFVARGLPTAPFLVVARPDLDRDRAAVLRRIETQFDYPVFVKPANLGSSVGISKVQDAARLGPALDLAALFDRKVIIEAAVPNAREIEVAVLGNDDPEASLPGEIVPADGCAFYDYAAKYVLESGLLIPAPLAPEQTSEVRRLAVEAYRTIDAAGLGRVDFLFDREAQAWHVSEVNTMPGFTTISMYPKLWEATGLGYAGLLDRLIALAFERHAARQALRTSAS